MSQVISLDILLNLGKLNTFEEGILRAYHEAFKSPLDKAHGAVIINNNKIIASGYNYELPGSITTKLKCCLL